jgi:hypothetical protein
VLQTLLDYYRVAEEPLRSLRFITPSPNGDVGFFRFGPHLGYGQCSSGVAEDAAGSAKFDAADSVRSTDSVIQLPFDPAEVIENLRFERYRQQGTRGLEQLASSKLARKSYYFFRRFLPFTIRRQLQRTYFQDWKAIPFPAWPVDFTVDNLHREFLRLCLESSGGKRLPFVWFWPEGAAGCLTVTHDVENRRGRDFTFQLMDLDESYGFKAAYQVIPEKRYEVPDEYICRIRDRGCEFNIHDLNHDGHLYLERTEFARRAANINGYVHRYGAKGFRAGAMYRKQEWYDLFEFSYDMSVPNVAHLEPLRGGCCTVMPYFIGKILELPLTTAQDYALFHILDDYSIDLWKQQLSLIRGRNGLISVLTHPDYLLERRSRQVYETLLNYLREFVVREGIWSALPAEVDRWWRARSQMRVVPRGEGWEITGPEKRRARLAYAALDGHHVTFELPSESPEAAQSNTLLRS